MAGVEYGIRLQTGRVIRVNSKERVEQNWEGGTPVVRPVGDWEELV